MKIEEDVNAIVPKVFGKDVLQSYVMTVARYDFSVYEKRIVYRLIENFQFLIQGLPLNVKHEVSEDLFGDYKVKMPIKSFLKDEIDDTNHSMVKTAIRSLELKRFEYEDEKMWTIIRFIQAPVFNKNSEFVSFTVRKEMFEALLNFDKGFRKYELNTIMSFESVYTMRFYELFSGQTKPITHTIDNLKLMFRLENSYTNNPSGFIKKVVLPAQKELDSKAPFSFKFEPKKTGKKITAICFSPVFIAKNRDAHLENKFLQKKISLRFDLDKLVINYLKENYYFSEDGIKSNITLFKEAYAKIDLLNFLSLHKATAMLKNKPQGWIIGVLRKTLNPEKNIKNPNISKRGKQNISEGTEEKEVSPMDLIKKISNKKIV